MVLILDGARAMIGVAMLLRPGSSGGVDRAIAAIFPFRVFCHLWVSVNACNFLSPAFAFVDIHWTSCCNFSKVRILE
jgi:hypothetical protein